MQTLCEGEDLGKPEIKRGDQEIKTRTLQEFEAFDTYSYSQH